MDSDNMKKWAKWAMSSIGYLCVIIFFVIDKMIGAIYQVTFTEVLCLCGVIIVLVLFCWLFVSFTMHFLLFREEEGRKAGFSAAKKDKKDEDLVCCSKDGTVLCSLNVGVRKYGLDYQNDEPISKKDRLYPQKYLYDVEENGSQGEAWKNIWIFSEDLSSELDSSENGAEPVVQNNIRNNESKYTFFYFNNTTQAIDNREKIENSIQEKYRHLLSFVPIDVSNGYIGNHTLPLLCGSILFSKKEREGELIFSEGYLSIRMGVKNNPIYYKMPRCMLHQYSNYFKEILNNYNKGGKL